MSNVFKREKFDKKGIVKDVQSLAGLVDKEIKKLVFGEVLAYDTTTKKWVKYIDGTHKVGTFLLGVSKEEIETVKEDTPVAILVAGQVRKEDIEAVKTNEALWTLLAKQGIYLI